MDFVFLNFYNWHGLKTPGTYKATILLQYQVAFSVDCHHYRPCKWCIFFLLQIPPTAHLWVQKQYAVHRLYIVLRLVSRWPDHQTKLITTLIVNSVWKLGHRETNRTERDERCTTCCFWSALAMQCSCCAIKHCFLGGASSLYLQVHV